MVPEGWSLEKVGHACSIKNNLRLPLSQDVRRQMQGVYPYFGPTGVLDYINEFRIDEEFALIGEDGDHFLKYRDKPMTVLYKGRANCNNHAHIIGDSENCLAKWFFYYFNHRNIIAFLSRQGAKRYKLKKADLEVLPIALPPLVEQTRIANILSTWDKAIETVEALIDNSRRQKQALIQQLLGKETQSLADWHSVALGKLGSTYGGLSGKNKDDFGDGQPFVPYMNVFDNSVIDPDRLDYVRIKDSESQNMVKYGDILFTTSSETPLEVGMSAVVLHEPDELYLNSFCFGFRLHDFNTLAPAFARHYFRGPDVRRDIARMAQGATRYNLSKKTLLKMSLALPSLDEQKNITSTIDCADSELNVFIALKRDLTTEKKALMQQLLTGKRRVKTDGAAA